MPSDERSAQTELSDVALNSSANVWRQTSAVRGVLTIALSARGGRDTAR